MYILNKVGYTNDLKAANSKLNIIRTVKAYSQKEIF